MNEFPVVQQLQGVMMTIETELTALVKFHTPSQTDENRYTALLDKDKVSSLEADFIKWINQKLVADGVIKLNLQKNYKKLIMYFHPNRSSYYSVDIIWLEHQLSEGKNNGACFKTLSACYEKLTQPAKFKEIEFSGINSKEDCRLWLEKLRDRSTKSSNQNLCNSLIGLLDESSSYFDSTGTIKPNALKTLIQFIPATIASFGTVWVMEELFAIYAIYFVILKAGRRLERSDYSELQTVGHLMEEYTTITAMTTTTIIVRVLEMLFWASRHCLTLSLQISSTLFTPLIAASPEVDKEKIDVVELCKDLILAGEHQQPGMKFDIPELKIIAAPFEKYLTLNTQQSFGDWRVGKEKRTMINAFLFHLRVIDQLPGSLDTKYTKIRNELAKIKKNKDVYNGKTAQALDYVEHIITILESPLLTELITCDPEQEAQLTP